MPDQPAAEVVVPGVTEGRPAERPGEPGIEGIAVGDHLMVVETAVRPGDERGGLFLLRKIAMSDHTDAELAKAVGGSTALAERFLKHALSALRADEAALTPEEATMSADIDRVIARLGEGIPKLHKQMDEIQARLRRPIGL